jgi:hypothetical protein
VQFLQIANDGNLFVNPIPLTSLDQQGIAERYDIMVDFSPFRIGDHLTLVNTLQQTDGRQPDRQLPLRQAPGKQFKRPGGSVESCNSASPVRFQAWTSRASSSTQQTPIPGWCRTS